MLIHALVCDHCDQRPFGPVETYRIGDGPELHICVSCQRKPFRQVQPSARGAAVAETVRLMLEARG